MVQEKNIFVKYKKVCNKGCGVLKQDNANEKRNKSLCERFRGSAWMQAQRERKNECEQFSGHPWGSKTSPQQAGKDRESDTLSKWDLGRCKSRRKGVGHEPPTPDSQRTAEPTAQGFSGFPKFQKCGSKKQQRRQARGQNQLKSRVCNAFSCVK